MNTTRTRKEGSALFTVMVVILTLAIVLGSMVNVAANRKLTATRLSDRSKAQAYAEAGLNEAYAKLSTNYDLRTVPEAFPATNYGAGRYDANLKLISDKLVVIVSTGWCGGASQEVTADVRNYGSGDAGTDFEWPSYLTNYAVICGGTFAFGGCGSVTVSNGGTILHSNSKLTITGDAEVSLDLESHTEVKLNNNVDMDGDVTAPTITVGSHVTYGSIITADVPIVTIPQIDLTPYYNIASSSGQVRTVGAGTNLTINYSTNIPGGVLWVNGDVTISGPAAVQINGTIIATGSINFSGAATLRCSTYGFALVSRDANVQHTSSGLLKGTVYCRSGNFNMNANGTLIGQVVAAGTVTKTGNSDAFVVNTVVPQDPDPNPWEITGDYPAVSAYQK